MKLTALAALAGLSTAFVIPDEKVMSEVAVETHDKQQSWTDKISSTEDEVIGGLKGLLDHAVDSSKNALDVALDAVENTYDSAVTRLHEDCYNAQDWLSSAHINVPLPESFEKDHDHDRGHDHDHDHDHDDDNDDDDDDHHHHRKPRRPGHRKPGRGGHHKKSKLTVWQLIAKSKYTTKFAELVSEFDDIVDALNSTSLNVTVFAPTDKAFEKIPSDADRPPREFIEKLLAYHIAPALYPAGRILVLHTIPTTLGGEGLSSDPEETPQRLRTNIGLRGLTLNYYSRVVAADIFGSNGVIHGIDSILIPPPKAARIIQFFPATLSTLELGLVKTGLFPVVNDTSNHLGGTLFAPTNTAWQRLGPKLTGYLFSPSGTKYLKALLKYHVVSNQTLYSDAYYGSQDSSSLYEESNGRRIPKGKGHIDLPTLLKDRYLSIDIVRFGRLIDIKINGYQSVDIQDIVAGDGVIHGLNFVIIPPKKIGDETELLTEGSMTVEELRERLEPFVEAEGELVTQEGDAGAQDGVRSWEL